MKHRHWFYLIAAILIWMNAAILGEIREIRKFIRGVPSSLRWEVGK